MYLAAPYRHHYDDPDSAAIPRLFRSRADAEDWLLTEHRVTGGQILEVERIELAPKFRLIHNYSNNPDDMEHIR